MKGMKFPVWRNISDFQKDAKIIDAGCDFFMFVQCYEVMCDDCLERKKLIIKLNFDPSFLIWRQKKFN